MDFQGFTSRTILIASGEHCRDLPFCKLLLSWTVQWSGPEKWARGGSADQSITQKRGIIPGDGHGERFPFFIWADLRKLYCVYSHHAEVCQPDVKSSTHKDGGREKERISSFTRNNEEMSHDRTTRTHFLIECLLIAGCHHTSCLHLISLSHMWY